MALAESLSSTHLSPYLSTLDHAKTPAINVAQLMQTWQSTHSLLGGCFPKLFENKVEKEGLLEELEE